MSDRRSDVGQARTAALEAMRRERYDLTQHRARRFLLAQSAILAFATVLVIASGLAGVLKQPLFGQSLIFCAVIGVMTAGGWGFYLGRGAKSAFVISFLYIDSIVAMAAYYRMGEFETPNLIGVTLLVVMAPLFTKRRHAYGLAAFQSVLYCVFLAGRYTGWLPYDSVLPGDLDEALRDIQYLGDCVFAFVLLSFGAAYLSGEASMEITVSQKHLEIEVEARTQELAEANQELHQRNAELEQFNAAVSHDLKSPLQSLLLASELLRQDSPRLDEDQRESVQAIKQSVLRMNALISELLKLSRIGTNLGEAVPVDMGLVVDEVRADLAALTQERSGCIESGVLPTVYGHRELLRDALQNLVENGLKYGCRDHPIVRIEDISAGTDQVTLAIEDNGPGIPESERTRVFQPFVQLDRTAPGVGVGLSITRRIIHLHRGAIRAEDSERLQGLRVILELPAVSVEDSVS